MIDKTARRHMLHKNRPDVTCCTIFGRVRDDVTFSHTFSLLSSSSHQGDDTGLSTARAPARAFTMQNEQGAISGYVMRKMPRGDDKWVRALNASSRRVAVVACVCAAGGRRARTGCSARGGSACRRSPRVSGQ